MNSLPFSGTRDRIRTLVACDGAVWVWPGIPLTIRRGAEIVPLPAETIRFWVTRLHGPEALYRELSSAIAKAAFNLAAGDALKAQQALDGLNLTTLSPDGVALAKVLAKEPGLASLDMSAHAGARTWCQQDIAVHLAVFEGQLAKLSKGGEFDEAKHPRWPAGAPESQGGRFAPGDGSGGFSISTEPPEAAPLLQTGRSVGRLPGPPKIPDLRPLGRLAYATVKDISRWAQAALELGEVHLVHNLLLGIEAIQWLNGKPAIIAMK